MISSATVYVNPKEFRDLMKMYNGRMSKLTADALNIQLMLEEASDNNGKVSCLDIRNAIMLLQTRMDSMDGMIDVMEENVASLINKAEMESEDE